MSSRRELANAIRVLSMDAVQKANSGHPGMPMGMADIAEVLWNDFLNHNPKNPHWLNRDRFILSNGHGSMLQYALLHLTGYRSISMDDIKQFRQLHSKTPGHPEYGYAEGIETTTGPLGQGIANGVGMALAERTLAAQFNRPGFHIIDHYTYVFLGDGCLMEGISHEACSLAGHMQLNKLIAFYDDNGISIDGKTAGWFSDDTPKRFEAYGWHVVKDVDGHDSAAIFKAITEAKSIKNKPTLIQCKTTIGFGAPNFAGSEKAHGAPLGEKEVALAREQLGWKYPPFYIPEEVYAAWNAEEKGAALENEWNQKWDQYAKNHPNLADVLKRRIEKKLPTGWKKILDDFILRKQQEMEKVATRKASEICLNMYGPMLPEFLGGSADLTGSNNTLWSGSKTITNTEYNGNYIYYGVREFGMAAVMNGIALHGGFLPYGGTFLVFSDYMRNAIRLSAMSKQRVVYVLTHDSIGLGEDGPTHQPIEHIAMLRNTPQLSVWRPCDVVETVAAWRAAIEYIDGPTALLLTRQTVPAQQRDPNAVMQIHKGGYILKDCEGDPEVIIIATGSEVQLAVGAYKELTKKGRKIRVISMPSTDVFLRQEKSYQDQILPPHIRSRVAIEAAATSYWYKLVGLDGKVIGIDTFGESAPAKDVFEYFGFTVEHVVNCIESFGV